jgi:hypothetical protein
LAFCLLPFALCLLPSPVSLAAIARQAKKNQDKAKGKVQKAKGKNGGKTHTEPAGAENGRASVTNLRRCNTGPARVPVLTWVRLN